MHHAKLYVDKLKEVKEHAKLSTQCATHDMVVSFMNDDLLLGSSPHNHSLLGIWWLHNQNYAKVYYE